MKDLHYISLNPNSHNTYSKWHWKWVWKGDTNDSLVLFYLGKDVGKKNSINET